MPRVTNAPASRRRRKRRLELAKGFYGSRSKLFRQATEAVDRAMVLHFKHRKERKRDFRALWIQRLGAACDLHGITYSRLIEGLTKAKVALNRKMLSEIAIHDPEGFAGIVTIAKGALPKSA
jgi:large subunit ribosomal protein L20